MNDVLTRKRRARPAGHTARPPVTFEDLYIFDKQQQIVPLRLNRAQQHLLSHLTGRDLVLKARQLGISTAVQAWLFITALTQTARIGTLAHDVETTQKLRDMMQGFYEGLPDEKRPERGMNNAARTYYPETKSWVFSGTAGNTRAGRGGTYSHVHGSEVAFWRSGARVLAGLLQGVPQSGSIVLESSANGAQGWFYDQCMRALAGEGIWTLHFYPWWWEDGYRLPVVEPLTLTDEERRLMQTHGLDLEQIAWRRSKQRELGRDFQQEYPEDPYQAFLRFDTGYFRLSGAVFSAAETPAARADRRCVAGLDFGQANDFTVCCVLDATTREQVDLLRVQRMAWADIRRAVLDLCIKWGVQTLVAESNSMGAPNIEAMLGEFAAAGCPTAIVPFATTYASKTTLLNELRLALEEGGLRLLPHPVQRRELEQYTAHKTASGLYQLGAPDGEHDDCVMALALAWRAAGTRSLIVFGG